MATQGVARFHLEKLIPDEYFKDGTLVVAPCNSPEQVPITLGGDASIFDHLRFLTSLLVNLIY